MFVSQPHTSPDSIPHNAHSPKLASFNSAKKSNLAWALRWLPSERRHDALIFYHFCRAIDDIADDPSRTPEEKQHLLHQWKQACDNTEKKVKPADTENGDKEELPRELKNVIERYQIDCNLLLEIIRGVEMDIVPRRFETFEDLRGYCWRVASVVGLVSIKIFGCKHPTSSLYAEQLGYALQITNILRDVGEDAGLGRIYLPLSDLAQFNVSETSILCKIPDGNFLGLMNFEAERANYYFKQAQANFPSTDAIALRSAEAMRRIYQKILTRMRKDQFRVFNKRYRLTKLQKLFLLFGNG